MPGVEKDIKDGVVRREVSRRDSLKLWMHQKVEKDEN